jgi:hypothetical protein
MVVSPGSRGRLEGTHGELSEGIDAPLVLLAARGERHGLEPLRPVSLLAASAHSVTAGTAWHSGRTYTSETLVPRLSHCATLTDSPPGQMKWSPPSTRRSYETSAVPSARQTSVRGRNVPSTEWIRYSGAPPRLIVVLRPESCERTSVVTPSAVAASSSGSTRVTCVLFGEDIGS